MQCFHKPDLVLYRRHSSSKHVGLLTRYQISQQATSPLGPQIHYPNQAKRFLLSFRVSGLGVALHGHKINT